MKNELRQYKLCFKNMLYVKYPLLLLGFLLFGLFSCQDKKDTEINLAYDFSYDTNKVERYKDIVYRIQKHAYPVDFRILKSFHTNDDNDSWLMNEEKILADSVAYHFALNEFLNEDIEIVHWLLSFKNDTLIDSNFYTPLFFPYQSPMSSNIPICLSFQRSPSRHAINYVIGYFSEGLKCVEQNDRAQAACILQHNEIEQFLVLSKNLSIEEKRKVWKFIQKQEVLNRIFIYRFVGYSG